MLTKFTVVIEANIDDKDLIQEEIQLGLDYIDGDIEIVILEVIEPN